MVTCRLKKLDWLLAQRGSKKTREMFRTMGWKCLFCVFSALYLSLLLTHLNSSHREEENINIICGISGCTRRFTKVNTYVKHVYSSHPQYLQLSHADNSMGPILIQDDPGCDDDNDNDDETDYIEPDEDSYSNTSDDSDTQANNVLDKIDDMPSLHDLAARYQIKIKETNKLTDKATQSIVATTSQLFAMTFKLLKREIEQLLSDVGLDLEDVPGISNAFDDVVNPFNNVQSTWRQMEYLKNDPKFVEPIKKVLGKKKTVVKRGNKKQIAEIEHAFYYIPVLDTIQVQLDSPKFLEIIIYGHKKADNPNILRDFCDGTFVSEHHLFGCDSQAIKILMYYDDVNVVNPTNNKIHQLGMFYYQIANLPPEYRSKLKSIQLFAICKKDYIKTYGLNKVLDPFIQELKILGSDTGHPFIVGEGLLHLRGTLLAVLADTPASQAVGGFKEGVGGARRKCRNCMATFELMQIFFYEEDFELRSQKEHEEQLQKLENAPSKFLQSYYSKYYGINSRGKVLDAPFFDVTQQLPQDIMHVFLEGILADHLKHFLKHCFDETNITLDKLNREVKMFPLGYSQLQNRPVLIKETDLESKSSSNLGQTASQMHLLIHILPFILAKYTDVEDTSPFWKCYMSLVEIMVICFSTAIATETIIYLKGAIAEYLQTYKALYNARITPKMHYLVHLPSTMLKFGPLIRSWCMRFEAKHSYFKDLSRVIKNFKNLPYSLSHRHQCMQFADNITIDKKCDPSPLFNNENTLGRAKEIRDDESIAYIQDCLKNFCDLNCTQNDGIYTLSSISIYGTLYKPGKNTYLVAGINNLPLFGRLMKIWYLHEHGIFFELHMMDTLGYNEDLNAHQVMDPDLPQCNEVLSEHSLLSEKIYHTYTFNNKLFIVQREFYP